MIKIKEITYEMLDNLTNMLLSEDEKDVKLGLQILDNMELNPYYNYILFHVNNDNLKFDEIEFFRRKIIKSRLWRKHYEPVYNLHHAIGVANKKEFYMACSGEYYFRTKQKYKRRE